MKRFLVLIILVSLLSVQFCTYAVCEESETWICDTCGSEVSGNFTIYVEAGKHQMNGFV